MTSATSRIRTLVGSSRLLLQFSLGLAVAVTVLMVLAVLAFRGIGAEWLGFITLLYLFGGFFLAAAGALFGLLFVMVPPYTRHSLAVGLAAVVWNAALMALRIYWFMPP